MAVKFHSAKKTYSFQLYLTVSRCNQIQMKMHQLKKVAKKGLKTFQ